VACVRLDTQSGIWRAIAPGARYRANGPSPVVFGLILRNNFVTALSRVAVKTVLWT